MRPEELSTQIFLDSGDPEETKEALAILGFLDGQTTNPSLIAKKNPEAKARLEAGDKFSHDEIYGFYKKVVQEISALIPEKSVSIEVYVDESTSVEEICRQAGEMSTWIDSAHIKYPLTKHGLACAEHSVKHGTNVNITLNFSQEQGAAVHAMSAGAKKGDVFISPFIGRLDDIGKNGMDLVKNELKMYKEANSHVQVLAASIRNLDHFLGALAVGVDIITAPLTILQEWAEAGMPIPGDDFVYPVKDLAEIPYKELDLSQNWDTFDLSHPKTSEGIQKFAADWNALIK